MPPFWDFYERGVGAGRGGGPMAIRGILKFVSVHLEIFKCLEKWVNKTFKIIKKTLKEF